MERICAPSFVIKRNAFYLQSFSVLRNACASLCILKISARPKFRFRFRPKPFKIQPNRNRNFFQFLASLFSSIKPFSKIYLRNSQKRNIIRQSLLEYAPPKTFFLLLKFELWKTLGKRMYSSAPNNRADRNKRAGRKIQSIIINYKGRKNTKCCSEYRMMSKNVEYIKKY